MSTAQVQPAFPLSNGLVADIDRLARGQDRNALWWLSGYLAGLAANSANSAPAADAPAVARNEAPAGRATIVYGSQTGNARRVAEQLAADSEAAGIPVRLLRADAYPLRELKDERQLFLVVSTQGDGDPPDDTRDFLDFLAGKRAPRLEQLKYAVLGLGDSSYPQFCAVGQVLDERLAALGAQRLFARGDADLDIATVADPWRALAVAKAKETFKPSATVTPLRPHAAAATPAHDRDRPFDAQWLGSQRITLGDKDVRHVELSLQGSGLRYAPGDALGVWPRNPERLVDAVLATLRLDGEAEIAHAGTTLSLRAWLSTRRELTRLAKPFVAAHAARARDPALAALLEPGNADLAPWLQRHQVIDLLQQRDAGWDGAALVDALRPLAPRLYSIASSQAVVGDEVHLTVAPVAYLHGGEQRWGAASQFLATRGDGDALPVYIEPNERFRLPQDMTRDVIMIGPGTGVAPFRAFLQERAATRPAVAGTAGRNWLFFGNPHFRSDFLYQLEWQRALKDGALDRIDLAFSRDGNAKTYVQHRIAQRARALYDWLQAGAHLYVCGAITMGKDVHAALVDAVASNNGGDHDAAASYLDELARNGRYARDVY